MPRSGATRKTSASRGWLSITRSLATTACHGRKLVIAQTTPTWSSAHTYRNTGSVHSYNYTLITEPDLFQNEIHLELYTYYISLGSGQHLYTLQCNLQAFCLCVTSIHIPIYQYSYTCTYCRVDLCLRCTTRRKVLPRRRRRSLRRVLLQGGRLRRGNAQSPLLRVMRRGRWVLAMVRWQLERSPRRTHNGTGSR